MTDTLINAKESRNVTSPSKNLKSILTYFSFYYIEKKIFNGKTIYLLNYNRRFSQS